MFERFARFTSVSRSTCIRECSNDRLLLSTRLSISAARDGSRPDEQFLAEIPVMEMRFLDTPLPFFRCMNNNTRLIKRVFGVA